MSEQSIIEIRGESTFLTLTFSHRVYPEAQDYWDGNWVVARFQAETPGIVVDFVAQAHLGDIVRFRDGLSHLNDALAGEAALAMMEEYLTVTGTVDARGRVQWATRIRHPFRGGARLEFGIKADQSYLPALLGQVDEVLACFPLRGRKPNAAARPARRITCLSVGVYGGQLTRGRQYELLALDEQKQQVKVQADNGRIRWFPEYNFDLSGGVVAELLDWRFDDAVHDELNNLDETKNCVDVTVRLSDGQVRWLIFVTPDYIKWLLEERSDPTRWGGAYKPAVWGEHIVVIRDLAMGTVDWMLKHLDQQGELIMHSRPVGGVDEPKDTPEDYS